jgi:hypothetical protein
MREEGSRCDVDAGKTVQRVRLQLRADTARHELGAHHRPRYGLRSGAHHAGHVAAESLAMMMTWAQMVNHVGHEVEVIGRRETAAPDATDLPDIIQVFCLTCREKLDELVEPSQRVRQTVLARMVKANENERRDHERAREDEADQWKNDKGGS